MSQQRSATINRPVPCPTPDAFTVNLNFKIHYLPLAIIAVLFMWSYSFIAIRESLQSYTPIELVIWRNVVSIFMAVLTLVLSTKVRAEVKKAYKEDLIPVIFMGLTGVTLYQLLIGYGQQTVPAGTTSLLMMLTPLICLGLGNLVFKEKLYKNIFFGGFLAFSGTLIIILGGNPDIGFDRNVIYILGAVTIQAVYFIIQKGLTKKYSPLTLVVLLVLVGSIFPPVLAYFNTPLSPFEALSISNFGVLFLGTGAGFISLIGWAYVLKSMDVSKASLLMYVVPPLTLFQAWLFLDEGLSILIGLSGLLILTGLYIANKKAI